MEKKLFTTREVAKLLNVSYMTIRNRIRDGKLPYIDINKGGEREIPRFDPDVINKMIKEN